MRLRSCWWEIVDGPQGSWPRSGGERPLSERADDDRWLRALHVFYVRAYRLIADPGHREGCLLWTVV